MDVRRKTYSIQRSHIRIALAVLFCCAWMFSATIAYAADIIKIGAVYPLSGGVADAASWVIDGIKMAQDEINANGGIAIEGKNLKIEYVIYDSKCDPTHGVSAVEKLINRDKVVIINGDYCSSCTLAQREVSERNKIVQVTPISVHPEITAPGHPYMFRFANTIDMFAEPFVEFVANKLPDVKNVGFLAITDDYGRSAVKIYTTLFQKYGAKVATVEYFKHGDTDFYTQITKLSSMKPDAVYIVTDEDAQNIGTLKQLKELGFKGRILGCSTYSTDRMVDIGGKDLLEGIYVEGHSFELIKDEPPAKAWLKKYKERFGREGNAFALAGYDSTNLIADVLKIANTLTNKEKIREAMRKTNLNDRVGYYGKPYFDENGQCYPYLGVIQYKNGKRVVAYKQKEKKQ